MALEDTKQMSYQSALNARTPDWVSRVAAQAALSA